MDELLYEIRMRPTRPGERIEIALSYPPLVAPGGALLCSPHPFLGGDLDNNVLRELARSLATSGWPVLRFNYRSVGNSQPVTADTQRYEYWKQVEQEQRHDAVLEDVVEAFDRVTRLFQPHLLCGYSFGAFVALKLAELRAPKLPLVLIAPPLSRLDFSALERRAAPTLLLTAEHDEFEPQLRPSLDCTIGSARHSVIGSANHFFLGHETLLAERVEEFLHEVQLTELTA